jgi:multicomponent Na+:H+ antiporter subunit F
MTPELIVEYASVAAIAILVVALFLTVYRAVVGPTLPDRIVALDMLVGIVLGFIAVIALRTGYTLYIDIAIALGLVGFLATVAFARFVLARGHVTDAGEGTPKRPGRYVEAKVPPSKPAKAASSGKAKKSAASLGKEAK